MSNSSQLLLYASARLKYHSKILFDMHQRLELGEDFEVDTDFFANMASEISEVIFEVDESFEGGPPDSGGGLPLEGKVVQLKTGTDG